MTAPKLRITPRPIGIDDQIDRYLDRRGHAVELDPPATVVDACNAFLIVARPGEPWLTLVSTLTAGDHSTKATRSAAWLHRVGDPARKWSSFPAPANRAQETAA